MNGPYLTNPLEEINQAWQQGRQNAFNDAAGQALTSTGQAQQDALTKASQINPTASLDLQQKNNQVTGAKLVNMAKFLVGAPDSQKDAIYQSLKPQLASLGMDPSTLPANYDDSVQQTAQSLVNAYTPYNAIPAAVRTMQYIGKDLSPDEQREQLRIRAGLDPRASKTNFTPGEIPDGQGGKIQAVFNHQSGKWEPSDYSRILTPEQQNAPPPSDATPGQIVQPSTPGTTLPNVNDGFLPFIQAANKRIANGENADAVQADLLKQKQAFDAQQAALGGLGSAAPASSGGLGYTPAKPDKNDITKRQEDLKALEANGVHLTPDEQQQYLLTGKAPASASPAPTLNDSQEQIAHLLANYRFNGGTRFFSDPKNQPIIARALEINPDFNQGKYNANQKFITDLASNAPTSGGGSVIAANTALKHLASLSDISEALPDHWTTAGGKLQDYLASNTNSDLGNQLKAWNTGVQLMAAEVQKMVKNGVATEGETKDMLANLSADAPKQQRRAALAKLAEFMNDKVQTQEDRRDQILGQNSPGTSLLTAQGQDNLRKVMQRGDVSVPTLRAPSTTMGFKQTAPASAPAADSGAPARPASQADFDALPSGALFINPKDGQLMRKH